MKQIGLVFLSVIFCFSGMRAQAPATSADIYLGLKKLSVLGSVLYIAAHPDDENTRLLTWLSKDGLYKTSYLSLTRGDGGQNLIGNEQGVELGLIRTQELLAARRVDGAEQYFTRAYDFGFSKTPEETFSKWGRQKILADVVWVIRQTRPDVIITRFPTTGEGGHGHHTASAILASEAFAAAADETKFPEQLKWVTPWKASRLLWNTFNFGATNTQRDDQLKIDVGAFNPVLGKSYGEIAAESRSQHKSQGFGVPRSRGEAVEYFSTIMGAAPQKTLFENIQTDWSRVKGSEGVSAQIDKTISSFDFLHPEKSVTQLVAIYKELKTLPKGYWKETKLQETETLIEQAGGLWLDAFTSEPFIAQTDSAHISFSVNARLDGKMMLKRVAVGQKDTVLNTALLKNKNVNLAQAFFVSPTVPITQPYWLQQKMADGSFTVSSQQDIGKPDVQPAFIAQFELLIEGETFVLSKPVRYKFTDPVKGEVYQPFVVMPPVLVETAPSLVMLTKSGGAATVTVTANKNIAATPMQTGLELAGEKLTQNATGQTFQKGSRKSVSFTIPMSNAALATPFNKLGKNVPDSLALSSIQYDHIPHINYFYTDAVKLLNNDIKTKGKKIGYIVGAGDKVPEALTIMGYEVTLLGATELNALKLQTFDAIITGVRAYNTNEWLNTYYDKLMEYVRSGGNLIVQYNTSNNIGPVRAKIGPYEFGISRNRVTNEEAAVTFLDPMHPALNYPNKITQSDFNGWIQERSVYHATGIDKAFTPIFSMADEGEKSDNGSLIIAPYGKGFFTYTGIVFFRELPAGVPGAFRLLANLIALNQQKQM